MLQNELVSHFLVTFIYFVVIFVLRLVGGSLGELRILGVLGMVGGAILGTFFLDIDHLLYWFVTHPEAEDSAEAKGIVRNIKGIEGIKGGIKGLYSLLKRVHTTHTRLIFHSAVGQAVLLILAIYLVSSGGSFFGSAFILAINLHLLKDEWFDYYHDKKHLVDWLFWQVRGVSTESQLTIYLVIASLVFLGITGLFI